MAASAAANPAWAGEVVAALVAGGVVHACLAPGSRSTPLALAWARADVGLTVHLDERSAAFYALGVAKATGRPAAVVCTSGTAGANMYPAVVEARMSGTPLVVLTADRPPELRDTGAWQTIDQVRLFGAYPLWFADLAPPAADPALLAYARDVALRAVAVAAGDPPGPVHLNIPFREPLLSAAPSGVAPAGAGERVWGDRQPPQDAVARIAARLAGLPHGLVMAGPDRPRKGLAEALARFAAVSGYPVAAEAASQLRFCSAVPGLLCGADAVLRAEPWLAGHIPEVVVRIGASPTWRPFGRLLAEHPPAELVVLDPDATWDDPSHGASWRVVADPAAVLGALADALAADAAHRTDPGWSDAWQAADAHRRAEAADAVRAAEPGTSLWVPQAVVDALPAGGVLVAANSMAVRDVDSFTEHRAAPLSVVTNRGAAGIDGTVSTALGAAAGAGAPTALLTGDLAFLHDVGGLAARPTAGPGVAAVVLNDRGGGIFAYLDVAETREFERLFRTPQDVDIAGVCAAYGVAHTLVDGPAQLRAGLQSALAGPGMTVLEVPLDMAANTAAHCAYWARVAARLA